MNLTAGCCHGCAFCSARAYAAYPGDDSLWLYRDTARQLELELAALRRKPKAVLVSPSTDPFPRSCEVQREAERVLRVLAEHNVQAWFMTRGLIRPFMLRALEAHREHVKVTIAITTMDRRVQRMLEPRAAPPRLRLRQLAQLKECAIPVQVAVEPLLPGITDTRSNLNDLFEALAGIGVERVTASYLFLRPGIRENLAKALHEFGYDDDLFAEFEAGPFLQSERLAGARFLPKIRRQHGYAALMARAAAFGISVRISGVTNPDFQRPRPITSAPLAGQRLLTFPS